MLSEPTMPTEPTTSTTPGTPPESSQFTFLYTMVYVQCVLAHYVGAMTVIVVVGVTLIIGTCIFLCIVFLYGRVSRDQVCTHIHVHCVILSDELLPFQEVFVGVIW